MVNGWFMQSRSHISCNWRCVTITEVAFHDDFCCVDSYTYQLLPKRTIYSGIYSILSYTSIAAHLFGMWRTDDFTMVCVRERHYNYGMSVEEKINDSTSMFVEQIIYP